MLSTSLGTRRTLVLATAATALASGARARAQQSLNFETAPVGPPPPGFTVGLTGRGPPPRWVVLEDPSSPAGPRVLTEISRDRTNERYSHAVLNGVTAQDVSVSVRFRPVDGRVDQAAGLIVRYRDAGNYYVARANALEGNVRLYRMVGGRRTQFAGVDARVPRDTWQMLGLRAAGDQLTVMLDGRELFSAVDRTFATAGQVGLWTKADSVTHFDGLEVETLR
jgi:hypothetical protein